MPNEQRAKRRKKKCGSASRSGEPEPGPAASTKASTASSGSSPRDAVSTRPGTGWSSSVPVPGSNMEPYYRARITIDRSQLRNVPANFQLTPGMPVTADIKIGKRTVLTYLLGRVLPVVTEAMREP